MTDADQLKLFSHNQLLLQKSVNDVGCQVEGLWQQLHADIAFQTFMMDTITASTAMHRLECTILFCSDIVRHISRPAMGLFYLEFEMHFHQPINQDGPHSIIDIRLYAHAWHQYFVVCMRWHTKRWLLGKHAYV